MLSEAGLRHISKNTDANYDFDLSTVHVSQYETLFRTLQKFALKHVESIGFNCSQLTKYESRLTEGNPLPSFVESSIARNKTHYVRNIIELLSYIAQKSSTLREIRLSYIFLRKEHIERLSTIISKSPNIKSLIIYHVLLKDEGVRALLHNMNPSTIQHISVVRCDLTGACTPDILNFIRKRMDERNGIQSFEVSPSEFCEADRRKIAEALAIQFIDNKKSLENKKKPKIIKVTARPLSDSGSLSMSGSSVKKEQNNQSFQNNDNEDEKLLKELIDNEDDIIRRKRIEELQTENNSIQNQIQLLNNMINASKVGQSLYVVGPGSSKFVTYLNSLETKLHELDMTPRNYP